MPHLMPQYERVDNEYGGHGRKMQRVDGSRVACVAQEQPHGRKFEQVDGARNKAYAEHLPCGVYAYGQYRVEQFAAGGNEA